MIGEDGKPKRDEEGRPVVEAKYSMHALRHFFAGLCINRREEGGTRIDAEAGSTATWTRDHFDDLGRVQPFVAVGR